MEKKANILIWDDNTSLCKSMSFILGRKSYAVATAKDRPEAIYETIERSDSAFLCYSKEERTGQYIEWGIEAAPGRNGPGGIRKKLWK